MPAPSPEAASPPSAPARVNHPEVEKILQAAGGMMRLAFLVYIVSNLLLAVWIFTDIRKRGERSGIFVALALVAGVPAAVIYSLVRIGDKLVPGGK